MRWLRNLSLKGLSQLTKKGIKMNVGLPGAGIGGLYYLICAAVIPFKELHLSLTNTEHRFRYRLVLTQLGIASTIIFGFILIYQLVNRLFDTDLSLPTLTETNGFAVSLYPVVISLALLLVILIIVELCAFIQKKKRQFKK